MASIIRKKLFNLGIPIKLYARLEKYAEKHEVTITAAILRFIHRGLEL